jgi:putative transposase
LDETYKLAKTNRKVIMQVQKSIKIPIHYDTTKAKLDKLENLTARITYCIRLISGLITEDIKIDRPSIRRLIKDNKIAPKTGLSAGFIDQCIDKVMWSWKSYRKLHKEWEQRINTAEERLQSARDQKEKEKRKKSLQKLLKKEPSKPTFHNKTPCRIDYRAGKVQWGQE